MKTRSMDSGLVTAWSIRLSLAAYAAVLMGLLGFDWRKHHVVWRAIWTAGFLLLVAHVICAFHFYHDWSHARAAAQPAKDTKSLLGWSFGGGLFFNYALIMVWCADVVWWCVAAARYERRSRTISAMVHGYMFFIAFNGAVVFERGPTRWVGMGVTSVLMALLARRLLADTKTTI